MNRFFISPKFLVAAALAGAALGAATVAEAARPEVRVSIGFQSGPRWSEPAPVYLRPPVYVSPREVFEGPRFGRYEVRRELKRERAWRRAEWLRHQELRRGDRRYHLDHRD